MKEYFKTIPNIPYEGEDSKNPLAFKYYNAQETVGGKTMEEHLRFSMAFWHTMNFSGTDPFGSPTVERPWLDITDPMEQAKAKMHAAFEIVGKLGIPFFCFHDRDIAPEGESLAETNRNLDEIVKITRKLIDDSGTKLLWGTANLFSNPRYMHGAATSPYPEVFACAAAQVKKALEITKELDGLNYVFWGGREGYAALINTDMGRELDNLAKFFHMAADYAKEIGFDGQFLIEPKPMEPTTHQYDFDCANSYGFLKKYGLADYFKFNVEMNHAILAGHSFRHELIYARINNMLGSIDANQGDYLLGWDTDRFPTTIYENVFALYEVLKNGGIAPGGLNFDAHPRRESHKPEDIFYCHISGMDGYAKALKIAYALYESGELEDIVEKRYEGYTHGIGEKIARGAVGFRELEDYAMGLGKIDVPSGERERIESVVNRYL
jgi:xylose isomerase